MKRALAIVAGFVVASALFSPRAVAKDKLFTVVEATILLECPGIDGDRGAELVLVGGDAREVEEHQLPRGDPTGAQRRNDVTRRTRLGASIQLKSLRT